MPAWFCCRGRRFAGRRGASGACRTVRAGVAHRRGARVRCARQGCVGGVALRRGGGGRPRRGVGAGCSWATRCAEAGFGGAFCEGVPAGPRVVRGPADVSDPEAVDRLAERAVAEFGRIDVWLNDAAVAAFGALEEVPYDIFRQVLDVNVLGCVAGARAALRVMRAQGHGTVINVSSAVGAAVVPYNTPYVLSKTAVRAMSASLRQELRLAGQQDIHVCTVLPATMATPFFRSAANYSGRQVTPMAPVYTAHRAARTVVRLTRRPRRETCAGPASHVLGLLSKLAPALVERVLALQTDRSHLSRNHGAEPAPRNVLCPRDEEASVGGGWHGRRRAAFRRTGATALAGGLVAVGLRTFRGSRRPGRPYAKD
ncbi:SDR family NAD(P)-dependent oxidoreductase [Streptomyces sp. NPDC058657]|uniref:SDR family NAD(P)-dependent oxidoreductase n=1 Tax=unclassified Streptomyces TaxID=2593676 RepID=UPI00365CC2BF